MVPYRSTCIGTVVHIVKRIFYCEMGSRPGHLYGEEKGAGEH